METPAQRRSRLSQVFQEQFSGSPTMWARAPGRVDLMGSHTDYNLGYVLTLPISRDTWIAARPCSERSVSAFATNLDARASFSLDHPERDSEQPWTNYLRGVASVLARERLPLHGFEAVIDTTVPIGSGLSSSAALECATATLFQTLGGWSLPPEQLARICQRAENTFVGVQCGILDQYSSCVGREGCALLLDCRSLESQPIPVGAGISIFICDTRASRELSNSAYGVRRAQCEEGARRIGVAALRDATMAQVDALDGVVDADVVKRCRFIVAENERVLNLARALPRSDRAAVARLCAESFAGARDLYEICSPPMLAMMRAMTAAPGTIGARQAGAGFGGCMAAFVDGATGHAFADAVRASYEGETAIRPEVYEVQAAAPAGMFA
jgi:galactokinase